MDPKLAKRTEVRDKYDSALIGAILALARREERSAGIPDRGLGLDTIIGLAPGTRVAILHSGGLDSATLLGLAARPLQLEVLALEFARGDRTAESRCARALASRLGVAMETLSYPCVGDHSLLPERYSIYLVTAAAHAAAKGAHILLTGLIYDDWIRGDTAGAAPLILGAVNHLLAIEAPEQPIAVAAPFAYTPKAIVAAISLALGIDETQSFSCLRSSEDFPCGVCIQCYARARALKEGQRILRTIRE